jgi:chorismate synthase
MSGNSFGEIFKVTTFGESHGAAMGCVIDGCPAGLELSASDIEKELSRRRPGIEYGSRGENDKPEILSGIFEGKTLGTPITIIVRNANFNSSDYDNLKDVFRPGHADYTWEAKYGFRDHRGGGRSSGRETLCRTAAGAVAKKILALHGIVVSAKAESEANIEEGDSAGGIISCLVTGLPVGLGEPVFDKLDARLAAAVMSIGACKGIEFGAGFAAAKLKGSENNDLPHEDGNGKFASNGGILGGITNGMPVVFRAAFKPTPSIGREQDSISLSRAENAVLRVKGRHDPCIVPRAVPCVEAAAAIALYDAYLDR